MPVTLMVAPRVVQEARSYAEFNGTTLDALLQSYLEDIASRERERRARAAKDMFDFLMSQKGELVDEYVFNREEANVR